MSQDQYADIYLKLASRSHSRLGDTRECKLCGHPAHPFANVDFNQSCERLPLPRSNILVEYFRCQRCELLFTDFFDEWSVQDFQKFIYNAEYINVDPEYSGARSRRVADDLLPTISGLEQLRILDYGSGSGYLEEILRRNGFNDISSYDPFSSPNPPEGMFDLITCFEVIEHTAQPRQTFDHILSLMAPDGCALVGQTLQPADIGFVRDKWWYIAPRNGHCTMYSPETLFVYAESKGLLFSDFGNLFALTTSQASQATQQIVADRRPQDRRLELAAPSPESGTYASWHDAEASPSGLFRWTREPRISFGVFKTPTGSFRVTFRHFGQRSDAFLDQCRISVGGLESIVSVHEDDVYAVFDLPFEAHREITLISPVPESDLALGIGSDTRPIGLAIACGSAAP